jgi:hypothetical protein
VRFEIEMIHDVHPLPVRVRLSCFPCKSRVKRSVLPIVFEVVIFPLLFSLRDAKVYDAVLLHQNLLRGPT